MAYVTDLMTSYMVKGQLVTKHIFQVTSPSVDVFAFCQFDIYYVIAMFVKKPAPTGHTDYWHILQSSVLS